MTDHEHGHGASRVSDFVENPIAVLPFSAPTGRGFAASSRIRATNLRRAFRGTDSSFLVADGLISTLWLATALQVSQFLLEIDAWLLSSFGEVVTDSGIHEIRNALFRLRRLHAEGTMKLGVQVNGGSPCSSHAGKIAS